MKRMKIAIGFCCVMQMADLLAFYYPRSLFCTSISVVNALCAVLAIVKLPELLEALSPAIANGGMGSPSRPLEDQTTEATAAESERYEALKARVHLLENDFERCDRLAQSGQAMNQLTELLAELESVIESVQA